MLPIIEIYANIGYSLKCWSQVRLILKIYIFIYFSWRLIPLQYCGGLYHTSTWISDGCTWIPPILNLPPTSLPIPSLWVVPQHQLWVSCFMNQTYVGHLFHIWLYTCFNAIFSNCPTLTFSHMVQKSVLYICVSFAVLHGGLSLLSF